VSTAEAKDRLRREMTRRRRELPAEARRRAGERVAERLLACPRFQSARRVALYSALRDELPTEPLLRAVLASGRPLLLPRAHPDGWPSFARVRDLAALEPGPWGALEPPAGAAPESIGPGDLLVVPGLAFDRRGARLGRGGGFYDRLLAGRGAPPFVVGVAFGFQLVAAVPTAAHDRPVDAVVTEQEVWSRDAARAAG
jgi:5-formyltetrahydrofolate cyclo-ligase